MGWLAAFGFRDPVVIPRPDVERDEVEQTLENRLISRYPKSMALHYTVRKGSDDDTVGIQVHAKRPREITVKVVPSSGGITKIEVDSGKRGRDACRFRRLLRSAPELRVALIEPTADYQGNIPDNLVSLLSVYAGQFGSYTTLLWQVPALGLTAQSFLLTIALMKDTSSGARIIACALSVIIALASAALMHNQRGRAINHAELLRRLSAKLGLSKFLYDSVELDDAIPKKTNAQNVWAVDHLIYHGWMLCMCLFGIADGLIILAVIFRPSLFGAATTFRS